jgi:hypothetical protein
MAVGIGSGYARLRRSSAGIASTYAINRHPELDSGSSAKRKYSTAGRGLGYVIAATPSSRMGRHFINRGGGVLLAVRNLRKTGMCIRTTVMFIQRVGMSTKSRLKYLPESNPAVSTAENEWSRCLALVKVCRPAVVWAACSAFIESEFCRIAGHLISWVEEPAASPAVRGIANSASVIFGVRSPAVIRDVNLSINQLNRKGGIL